MFPGLYDVSQSQPKQSWYPRREGASSPASLFDSMPDSYDPNDIGSTYRSRRASFDFSDSSNVSQSVPSSATSSNVHLPLPGTRRVFDTTSDNIHGQEQPRFAPSSQPSNYYVLPQHVGSVGIEDIVPYFPNATSRPAQLSSHSQQASLHDNFDDIRSCEALVNARNASSILKLARRRRRTRPPSSNASPAPPSSAGSDL